ncbi:hypothetical protein HY489_06305 [Candidatus Woesearchaeota archaeon]|nr:hypothetical protein [Candidatus Woesearchaeota archaeon]
MHEVEYIGPLTNEQYERLSHFFQENGKFIKEKKRLSLLYFRGEIPEDINDIKDEQVDLRIRITNKQPELTLKHGTFRPTNGRKEITVQLTSDQLQAQTQLLCH